MKVGILTFHNAYNYGAVLQAFSLQSAIEKLGHQAIILNFENDAIAQTYDIYQNTRRKYRLFFKVFLPNRLKNELSTANTRYRNFDFFFQHFYHLSEPLNSNDLKNIAGEFDAIIGGSDQIWNMEITNHSLEYFLSFANRKMVRKIAYAPSFGAYKIPSEDIDLLTPLINDFDYLSVRESTAAEKLRGFSKNSISYVLDPVFLLNISEWDTIKAKPVCDKPYVFMYNIGDDANLNDAAKDAAQKLGLPLYGICLTSVIPMQKKIYIDKSGMGPTDFISLISSAQLILTNSFHCTAFSVLYQKPFIVVKSLKVDNGRQQEFLRQIGMEDNIMQNIEICDFDRLLNYDYKKTQRILDKKIELSYHFLSEALE